MKRCFPLTTHWRGWLSRSSLALRMVPVGDSIKEDSNMLGNKICGSCGKIIPYKETCSCKIIARRIKNGNNRERNKELMTTKWKKFREQIIDRDQGVCMRCLYKYSIIEEGNLQVHHIKPRIKYPELHYEVTNCVTLCATCNHQLGVQEELDFDFTPTEFYSDYCL